MSDPRPINRLDLRLIGKGQPVADLPADEQVQIYKNVVTQGNEQLPRLDSILTKADSLLPGDPKDNAPEIRKLLASYHTGVLELLPRLNRALDMGEDDPEVLRKKLVQCQTDLAEAQQALFKTQQENQNLRQDSERRQKLLDEVQARNAVLEARINEFEQRVSTEPATFGAALGKAVDAIQQGLTSLENPFVDYGLQELDLQTQVNLQFSDTGQLQIRFPGLNEPIAPQNLSQLQLRLRPIPKSQQPE
jgi:hypothetical protein